MENPTLIWLCFFLGVSVGANIFLGITVYNFSKKIRALRFENRELSDALHLTHKMAPVVKKQQN